MRRNSHFSNKTMLNTNPSIMVFTFPWNAAICILACCTSPPNVASSSPPPTLKKKLNSRVTSYTLHILKHFFNDM